ncbi:MAG TPA: hypothetical protein VNG51_01435 [Ktedonobacteraceae bacterium]|nr:hypothetical protein [Ktedonobacteraceae bacterium]
MATPATTTTVSEKDLEELDTLLQEMKTRANEAHDKGNEVLLGVYAALVKVVSPEVQRLHARVEREDRAAINKKKKVLSKARRDAAAQQQSA